MKPPSYCSTLPLELLTDTDDGLLYTADLEIFPFSSSEYWPLGSVTSLVVEANLEMSEPVVLDDLPDTL